jgi:hypothetical protein
MILNASALMKVIFGKYHFVLGGHLMYSYNAVLRFAYSIMS